MGEAILRFFGTDGFMPHGMCYLWRPGILSLHVVSDALIGASYFSISFTLGYFMRRRKDLEFNWVIGCFAVFIIACGWTHWMEIVTIWDPYYWLSGSIKAVTAAASVPTAVLLVKLMPQALRWPSPASLRQTNEELHQANARMISEIKERERAQADARAANLGLQEQLAEMRRLHELSTRLAQVQKTSNVLEEILAATMSLQGADFGHLQLYDEETDSLRIVSQRGFSKEFLEHFKIVRAGDSSVGGRALSARERVMVEDIAREASSAQHVVIAAREGYRAVECSPILGRDGRVKGMLSVYFREPHLPSENHLQLTDLYLRLAAELLQRAQDEQALREARDAADLANRTKGRFLATASHDLRQPMQTLSLLNGSLRRMSATAEVSQALAEQEEAIGAMSRLTNSLLDISKLESGTVQAQIQDVDVDSLFEELRVEFASLAQKKGLALELASSGEVAMSDPVLLGQILRNLVGNAIRYTQQGKVQIRCKREGESRLCIEVEDTGIGIAEDHLSHIFEEFYQVGIAPNTMREGHGLGLSIVQRAAKLLGHELRIRSQPGRGTTFSIFAPAGVATRSPRVKAVPLPGGNRPGRAHVLVVDDDAAVLRATRMLLKVEGFEVSVAPSLAEAVRVAATHRDIRILITDYHLGDGELGTQVIDAVRRVLGPGLRAVLVSGDTSGVIRVAVPDRNVRLASKPVVTEELLQILSELGKAEEGPAERGAPP